MHRVAPILVLTALLCCAGSVDLFSGDSFSVKSAEAAPVSNVAVVDMLQLIEAHPETAQVRQAFDDAKKKAQENLDRSKTRIEKLNAELVAMGKDDPDRRAKESQILMQVVTAEHSAKRLLQIAGQEYMDGLEQAFNAVRSIVKDYARKNGIQLVLQKTEDDLSPRDEQDFIWKVALRGVLYSEAELDITEAVKKELPKQ